MLPTIAPLTIRRLSEQQAPVRRRVITDLDGGPVVEVVAGRDAGRRLRLGEGVHLSGPTGEVWLAASADDAAREVACGDTRVTVTAGRSRAPVRLTPGPGGTTLVHRAPILSESLDPVRIEFPDPPKPPVLPPIPWVMALVPLLLTVPIALWWRQPIFLVLGLLSPILMLTQHRLEIRRRRAEYAAATAEYDLLDQQHTGRLTSAIAACVARAHRDHPDLAAVSATVGYLESGPGELLWHRRRGARPVVRLGLADRPVPVTVQRQRTSDDVVAENVPLTLDLAEIGTLGLYGPTDLLAAFVDGLIGQLAVWHSPVDLRLIAEEAGLDPGVARPWWSDLPHARDNTQAIHRSDRSATPDRWSVRIQTSAGQFWRPPSGDRSVLIAMARSRQDLPTHCRAVISLSSSDGHLRARLSIDGAGGHEFLPDLPCPQWGVQIGTALRDLRDAADQGADQELPDQVRLLDLLDTDPARMAQRWLTEPTWRVPVGRARPDPDLPSSDGVWWLDLVTDGPHALVAGTTGSGKSELLISWIAALATVAGPDRLTFLLVDFKGAAAFGPLTDLPQVTGVISDLDSSCAHRVLSSLKAELRRREQLLANGAPAPPRLVIVVDEFRVLAEEHPDLLNGLVRVATVGRSLGVHLVLATQRPSGVVSHQIRANTNLRVCLRVRDALDSHEVIENAQAAQITAAQPGRAVRRSGGGASDLVQVAHLPERDRAHLIAAVRATATLLGAQPADAVWLPPLPPRLAWPALLQLSLTEVDRAPTETTGPSSVLPYALADLPEEQRRALVTWRPQVDGALAVLGGPRSGRTTLLQCLAQAADQLSDLTIRVLDAGDSVPADWPAQTELIKAQDTSRCAQLLDDLQCPQPQAVSQGQVVLIDGWESLMQSWAAIDHGRSVDRLLAVVRDGSRRGVHVVACGGRALAGSASSAFAQRVLMAGTDPALALILGAPTGVAQGGPPGRAQWPRPTGGWITVQVALPSQKAGRITTQ